MLKQRVNKMKSSMTYYDTGAGFPIILGHSYFFSKDMWKHQIESLSQYYRVIAPDLWAHGDSPALPDGRKSMEDLADDHYALITSLGISEFAIVGLSVGGMWGAELAYKYPQTVKALVLMDTDLACEPDETKKIYFNNLKIIEQDGKIPAEMCNYLVSLFYTSNASGALKEQLYSYLITLSADRLRESIIPLGHIIFGRNNRLNILNDISCPALVMTGENDIPRPPSEGVRIAGLLSCEYQTVPNAAHISNIENPDFVNKQLLAFFNKNL